MKVLFPPATLVLMVLVVAAQPYGKPQSAEPACAVCGKSPLSGQIWRYQPQDVLVCDECHQVSVRCAHCGLPVRGDYRRTSDGRIFCQRDMPGLVFSTNEVAVVFEETVKAVAQMTRGEMTLRHPAISVAMTDSDDWNRGVSAAMRRNGFAQSRPVNGELAHLVVLLSGQARDDLKSVCAHEYTHLWLNENLPKEHTLKPDTVEAICEIVAYSLAENRGQKKQMESIRVNPYTHGEITNVMAFHSRFGLHKVLEFARHGREPVLGAGQAAPTAGDYTPEWQRKSAGPVLLDRLTLTGIAGSATRRFALINGTMFSLNNRKTVRLKDRSVNVKCLEITENAVVIEVDGKEPSVTLLLGR